MKKLLFALIITLGVMGTGELMAQNKKRIQLAAFAGNQTGASASALLTNNFSVGVEYAELGEFTTFSELSDEHDNPAYSTLHTASLDLNYSTDYSGKVAFSFGLAPGYGWAEAGEAFTLKTYLRFDVKIVGPVYAFASANVYFLSEMGEFMSGGLLMRDDKSPFNANGGIMLRF